MLRWALVFPGNRIGRGLVGLHQCRGRIVRYREDLVLYLPRQCFLVLLVLGLTAARRLTGG